MPIRFLRSVSFAATCAALLAGTSPQAIAQSKDFTSVRGLAGAYLAGRAATYEGNFEATADYFSRALARDPKNPVLLENVVFARLAMGQLERAAPIAQRISDLGAVSQMANVAIVGELALKEDYAAILGRDLETQTTGNLTEGLIRAWAHLGEGAVSQSVDALNELAEDSNLKFFANYHRALTLASVGDYQGAAALMEEEDRRLARASRRSALAYVQILSQLDRNGDAIAFMENAFGNRFDPALKRVSDALLQDETLAFDIAPTPQAGLAEAFFTLSVVLSGETSADLALIYARLTAALRPDHVDAILLSADLLDELDQYDLAIEAYGSVPADHPEYHAAEIGRADVLRRSGKPDAAIEVLNQLSKAHPNDPTVFSELGDLFRQQEDYAKAENAYDRALELTAPETTGRWLLLYARGISNERQDDWEQAEADFRAALALNPNQPQVLNYLGYSLVEKQTKLDEALAMIERAVEAQPEAGYIVDSLGWVLYRLGRYEEAVGHMETAVELMPVDPVVTDHLGDVYWAVGRFREAEFQWSRALSFIDPEDTDGEADPERIRRKLEVGLDAVLAEEGAEPLRVAQDG
ncbi:tetratricopeptide repeat protein [Epibacterium sp. SM1969]|uniref:Tetratricopeptide repeat protein n=1 Tax=Tritonibacter aquimaris TaxID=2663379 RepID=A0A844AWQ9_9RHOB|nr:tetratricopeptide repeat protein [Tritonibacter aquimaris]